MMMPSDKPLSREEKERLMALSIIPLIPILMLFIVYVAQLKSMGVIASFSDAFGYVIIAATLLLAIGCGIYEVASSFKVKEPLLFRIKRFLSRSLFFSAFMLVFYAFWSFFSLLLASVLTVEYIVLLSLLSLSLTFFVLVKNPKTGQFIKKLTMEE
jgi:hypothetical protein